MHYCRRRYGREYPAGRARTVVNYEKNRYIGSRKYVHMCVIT